MKNHIFITTLILTAFALILVPAASAVQPNSVGIACQFVNDDGEGIASANVNVSIYNVSTGGSPLYSEMFTGATDAFGRCTFSNIGVASDVPVVAGQTYYLQLAVNGDVYEWEDNAQRNEFVAWWGQNTEVTGTITADAFVGDGSGLSGVVTGTGDASGPIITLGEDISSVAEMSVNIGYSAQSEGTGGGNAGAVAIGHSSNAGLRSISLGRNTVTHAGAVAIGMGAFATSRGVAIGESSQAGLYSIAIGEKAVATSDSNAVFHASGPASSNFVNSQSNSFLFGVAGSPMVRFNETGIYHYVTSTPNILATQDWVTANTGGASPAGANNSLQFNQDGEFGGSTIDYIGSWDGWAEAIEYNGIARVAFQEYETGKGYIEITTSSGTNDYVAGVYLAENGGGMWNPHGELQISENFFIFERSDRRFSFGVSGQNTILNFNQSVNQEFSFPSSSGVIATEDWVTANAGGVDEAANYTWTGTHNFTGATLEGVSTSPAGANNSLQFNQDGEFAGASGLSYDPSYDGFLDGLVLNNAILGSDGVCATLMLGDYDSAFWACDDQAQVYRGDSNALILSNDSGTETSTIYNPDARLRVGTFSPFRMTTMDFSESSGVFMFPSSNGTVATQEWVTANAGGVDEAANYTWTGTHNFTGATLEGVSTSPAGANNSLQFNQDGEFAGAGFTYELWDGWLPSIVSGSGKSAIGMEYNNANDYYIAMHVDDLYETSFYLQNSGGRQVAFLEAKDFIQFLSNKVIFQSPLGYSIFNVTQGNTSNPILLETPADSGVIATQDWVTANAGGASPAGANNSLQFNQDGEFAGTLIEYSSLVDGWIDGFTDGNSGFGFINQGLAFYAQDYVGGIDMGFDANGIELWTAQNRRITLYSDEILLSGPNSGQLFLVPLSTGNVSLESPAESGVIATQDWVTANAGGGSPDGANNSLQFNQDGAFAGTVFTYDPAYEDYIRGFVNNDSVFGFWDDDGFAIVAGKDYEGAAVYLNPEFMYFDQLNPNASTRFTIESGVVEFIRLDTSDGFDLVFNSTGNQRQQLIVPSDSGVIATQEWVTANAGGGSPAGANNSLQFNQDGEFAGAEFKYENWDGWIPSIVRGESAIGIGVDDTSNYYIAMHLNNLYESTFYLQHLNGEESAVLEAPDYVEIRSNAHIFNTDSNYLRLNITQGTGASPVVLETPADSGVIATQEWVTANSGGAGFNTDMIEYVENVTTINSGGFSLVGRKGAIELVPASNNSTGFAYVNNEDTYQTEAYFDTDGFYFGHDDGATGTYNSLTMGNSYSIGGGLDFFGDRFIVNTVSGINISNTNVVFSNGASVTTNATCITLTSPDGSNSFDVCNN